MLEAILEVHGNRRVEWAFHADFDGLKHEGTHPDIVRIVENSSFKSMIPQGKRFKDLHPLGYL
jgi:hypothetical protein